MRLKFERKKNTSLIYWLIRNEIMQPVRNNVGLSNKQTNLKAIFFITKNKTRHSKQNRCFLLSILSWLLLFLYRWNQKNTAGETTQEKKKTFSPLNIAKFQTIVQTNKLRKIWSRINIGTSTRNRVFVQQTGKKIR